MVAAGGSSRAASGGVSSNSGGMWRGVSMMTTFWWFSGIGEEEAVRRGIGFGRLLYLLCEKQCYAKCSGVFFLVWVISQVTLPFLLGIKDLWQLDPILR
jgi:hypothetical protein